MGLIPNKVVTVSCTQRFTYKIDLELKAQNIHQYRTRSTNHPFHAIINFIFLFFSCYSHQISDNNSFHVKNKSFFF